MSHARDVHVQLYMPTLTPRTKGFRALGVSRYRVAVSSRAKSGEGFAMKWLYVGMHVIHYGDADRSILVAYNPSALKPFNRLQTHLPKCVWRGVVDMRSSNARGRAVC
eukprot:9255544-Pyramimonas_sp.AAC.1